MNRQIKFRAWVDSGISKGMWNNVIVDGNMICTNLIEDKWFTGTPLQYTGLKDKNGIEIYEGDIVLANGSESVLDYDFSDARKYVSSTIQDSRHFEKRRSHYEVYWQSNFSCFCFKSLSDPKHSIESDVTKRDIKVIGNIYENPELLQSTNQLNQTS